MRLLLLVGLFGLLRADDPAEIAPPIEPDLAPTVPPIPVPKTRLNDKDELLFVQAVRNRQFCGVTGSFRSGDMEIAPR